MITRSVVLRYVLGAAVLMGAAASLSAQLPTDTQVWKDRCNLMASSTTAIQNGNPPAALVAATRGVPARNFLVLAVDRAQAGNHYVACTMYYMAAVAERAGNGGVASDPLLVTNYGVIGGSELRLAHHQHLLMHQHVVRVKMKIKEMTGQPLALQPEETSAVLDAAGTAPITLATPPANQQASNAKTR